MSEGSSEFTPQSLQTETGTNRRVSRKEFLKTAGKGAATIAALELLGSSTPQSETTTIPSIQPENSIQPEVLESNLKEDEFYVVMPGFGGDGKDLTIIRGLMDEKYGPNNNYVPSSIVEKEAFARKDLQGGYYKKLAMEIAKKAGDRKIRIVGHSLGGLEMLQVSEELLQTDWSGNNLELEFYVTPGLGVTGVLSLVDMGLRVSDMSKRFGELDQHILYPLPEQYYQGREVQIPSGYTLVEDTLEDRVNRRNAFVSLATEHPEVFTSGEPSKILKDLDDIGAKIVDSGNTEPIEQLLRQRGDIIRPVLDALAAGEHVDNEVHNKMLTRYNEIDSQLITRESSQSTTALLSTYANLIGAIGGIANRLDQGVDKVIAKIVNRAERRGVNATIDLVLAENDLALTTGDVRVFKDRLGSKGLGGIIKTILFMQNEGHTTFGYTRVVPDKVLKNTGAKANSSNTAQ